MTYLIKYGRTFHLKSSPGVSSDDKIIKTMDNLYNHEVVITEKMDGENTTIHYQGCHARSVDAKGHSSRDWMRNFASTVSYQLKPTERIVGEYLYARHSIEYKDLPSFFMGFAVIKDGVFLDWNTTEKILSDLQIVSVPVLFKGVFTPDIEKEIIHNLDTQTQEGFVVRQLGSFSEVSMNTHMAKYVRANHVKTDKHWMHQEIKINSLN